MIYYERGLSSPESYSVTVPNHLLVNTMVIPPSVLVSKFKVNTRLEVLIKTSSCLTVSSDHEFDMIILILFLFPYSLLTLIFLSNILTFQH